MNSILINFDELWAEINIGRISGICESFGGHLKQLDL